MQISFVMLIFLLFSDQISGEGDKSLWGGKLPQVSGGAPPATLWKKARNENAFKYRRY